jgi:hypothetical protein
MKLKHMSLLFATAGTFFLYFLSILAEPAIVELYEIPDFEGKKVITEGVVIEYFTTRYASQIITIKNNNSTALVYLEGTCDVEYGDRIQAIGEVQRYREDWRIVVDNKKNLKIIEKWNNVSFPIWQLAQAPEKYLGLNVNVTGYIEAISSSHFYIVDFEHKHSLIVFYKRHQNLTLHAGKSVCVSGKFLFDETNFRYKIELFDENHGVFLDKEG